MSFLNTHLAFLLVVMLGAAQQAWAQRTTIEMDEQCRQWYKLAMSDTHSQRSLQYADSIEMRGRLHGLRLSKLRAEEIRLYHYAHFDRFDKMHEAAEALRHEAAAANERRTFFYSYDKEVSTLLQYGQTVQALRSAREMESKIQPNESAYAKYITKRALGKVYYYRRDYRRAVQELDEALVFAPEACKERKGLKTADAQVMLADSRFHLRQLPESKRGFENGLRAAVDLTDSIETNLSYAQMLIAQGDKDKFSKVFSLLEELQKKRKFNNTQQESFNVLQAYSYMYDSNYANAIRTADLVRDNEKRMRLKRNIYRQMGDYAKALEYQQRLIELKDELYQELTDQDIRLLNEELNNKEMRQQAERQEAELMQLRIRQEQQKQEQVKEQTRVNELTAAQERKQATEDSLRAETERKKMEMARMQTASNREKLKLENRNIYYGNIVICIAIFILICVVISMMFIWSRNRSAAKKLALMNQQLKIAHKEALRTNKIKSEFIQSMNYEVRAPLNEVLGFAQLLGSKEMPISEEERIEYVQHITESAMELNSLIDKMLEYHEGKS